MKVLWFSNTPANADEYFNAELKGSGGWLQALDQSLQNKVELHVAFSKQHNEVFKYKKTTYYPIPTNQSFYNRALTRFFGYSYEKKNLPRYLEIISQVKPDIIHIHGTENPFTCIIPHIKIPLVVSVQGIITVVREKYCSGFDSHLLHVKDRKVSSLKNILLPWSFYVQFTIFSKLSAIELKNLLLVKNIIGRTSWDKRVTSIMAPGSEYYHGDEILRDSFYQHEWAPQISDKKISIHTTNSNDFYKGFETICMALNEINKIEINCEWRIAGIAPNDLIVKITKKKLKSDYPQNGLILLGNLNQDTLIKSLLHADMYVTASHIDNSPNGLCEAMILGLPCISTFVGGVGSLLKDGEEGILIQDGDPWAMAGAILEMHRNKNKSIVLGQNARKQALSRHDRTKIINNLIDIYNNIIYKSN